jgi:hypothetical protein
MKTSSSLNILVLILSLSLINDVLSSKLTKSQRNHLEERFKEIRKNLLPIDRTKSDRFQQKKFSVDPHQTFILVDPGENRTLGQSRKLFKRDACPGGNGNYGFNSFNFMTLVLVG